jgi:uncharacterized protein YecT (DUF1311 family)
MRPVMVFIVIFLMSHGDGAAQQIDCTYSTDLPQQAMNACAAQAFRAADAQLNAIWPVMRQWAKDTDTSVGEWQPEHAVAWDNLLKAQRAWIDYRDAHCRTESMMAAGGTLQPLLSATCRTTLTKERIRQLKSLLEVAK